MKRIGHSLITLLVACAGIARAAQAQVGAPYCFGASCPCGNDDPTAGCGNAGHDGDDATGARLEAVAGSAEWLRDDLVLAVRGVAPAQLGIVFAGGAPANAPFGDGLRCVVAGGASLLRFPVRAADLEGTYAESAFVRAAADAPGGGIAPGTTWYFQGWFRDPAGPCGNGFNLSNGLPVTFQPSSGPLRVELAGSPLAEYPFFQHVLSVFEGEPVHLALDPFLYWFAQGETADAYVVASKSAPEWDADPLLFDVRGAPQALIFVGDTLSENVFEIDSGLLDGTEGDAVGVAYDLVLDFDRDGLLGPGDLIDGYDGTGGFYVLRDTAAPGPHAVVEVFYNGGGFLQQDIYYPADIASMAQLPLVVVSHGNGHNYTWYDHIGFHLASYGYVVMSHRNNTIPGPDAASITTLDNTDHLIGNQDTIAEGVLNGHIDAHRIVWIGHSRGGEGVVRAYDRLFDGTNTPLYFGIDDVRLVSSIAPTNFLGINSANPHGVDYHLWVGSADADVSGAPSLNIGQSYQLFERATGRRASTTLQGAGHAVFHNGGGAPVASGPCQIPAATCHGIMRGYLLPLVRFCLEGDRASEELLWRPYDTFRPPSAPPQTDPCVIVHLEYEEGPTAEHFVIDNSQAGDSTAVSSSHGPIESDVTNLVELRSDDLDFSFTWTDADPPNGMTRGFISDETRGVLFDWQQPSSYELGIVPMQRDFSDDACLSFRVCQATRHPDTIAELGDLTFTVALRDGTGAESSISIGTYGFGVGEPYQRTGEGIGAGWANEFETLRVRLADFVADGRSLRLWDVHAVRFELGGDAGSAVGRLGLDDIAITRP